MSHPVRKDTTSPQRNPKPARPYNVADLRDYSRFRTDFKKAFALGQGGDGTVVAYQHTRSTSLIAVKTPVCAKARAHLFAEIQNLRALGEHPHIVAMVAFCADFQPRGPAVFLDVCELGDLNGYMELLAAQQLRLRLRHGRRSSSSSSSSSRSGSSSSSRSGSSSSSSRSGSMVLRIPEATVWKLLRDMSLALEYMHNRYAHGDGNGNGGGYLHNDVKPGNILVTFPPSWSFDNDNDNDDGVGGGGGDIPTEPTFQLTDFSRVTPYPAPTATTASHSTYTRFLGTPEYAPPPSEQHSLRPSSDIYSLGATLQTLALRIYPTQSRESFISARKARRRSYPSLVDDAAWGESYWRCALRTVYRPLSLHHTELRRDWDFGDSLRVMAVDEKMGEGMGEDRGGERPYSKALEAWYRALWHLVPEERISAGLLGSWCVPRVEGEMEIVRCVDEAYECFERAKRVREGVERRRVGVGLVMRGMVGMVGRESPEL